MTHMCTGKNSEVCEWFPSLNYTVDPLNADPLRCGPLVYPDTYLRSQPLPVENLQDETPEFELRTLDNPETGHFLLAHDQNTIQIILTMRT